MKKLEAIGLSTVVLAIAGCGGGGGNSTTTTAAAPTASTATPATASAAQISTKTLSGLGTVLVNARGRTLYIFEPDAHSKVTCTGTCAQLWPPAKLSSGHKPTASGQAKASLLGSDPDPEGGRVLTYAGWPLYTYISDSTAGSATGQALNMNGGLWYVLSPSGKPITKTP